MLFFNPKMEQIVRYIGKNIGNIITPKWFYFLNTFLCFLVPHIEFTCVIMIKFA